MNELYGSTSTTAAVPIEKVPSGVPGLDEVLCGGLPKASPSLIFGGTGTGKTLLGLSFALACGARGEAAVFASFEQGADEVRRHARTVGLDLQGLEDAGLATVMGEPLPPDADKDPDRTMSKMYDAIAADCERIDARHIVLDGVDLYTGLLPSASRERAELRFIRRWAVERRMTVLVTAKEDVERGIGTFDDFLNYGVDCSIRVFHTVEGHAAARKLQVIKYRGSGFLSGPHALHVGERGAVVAPLPRAIAKESAHPASFSSGNAAFDAALGGGLLRGASNVVAGPSGSGKTSFLSMIAAAALRRGERVLWLDLETPLENRGEPAADAGRAGAEEGRGSYRLVTALPEAADAEELLFSVLEVMERFKPELLVLDSLSACRRLGSEQTAREFAVRLFAEATVAGVTRVIAYLTSPAHHDLVFDDRDLGPAFGTIVRLKLVSGASGFERQLAVVKRRGAEHSRQIHAFEIRDDGIEMVAPRQSQPQARWRVSA